MQEVIEKGSKALKKYTHGNLNKEKSKRIKYLDVARGITIILMIIGHVIGGGIKRNIIFSFHMPLFIIINGYFSKENEKFSNLIKKSFLNLILPCIFTTILVNLIKAFLDNISIIDTLVNTMKQLLLAYSYEGNISFYNISSIGVLWFVFTLVCSKVIFYLLKKIVKNEIIGLGILSYVLLSIGMYLGINKIWLPFSFDISLVFVFYTYIGYIFNKMDLLENIFKNKFTVFCLFVVWIIGIKMGNIELAIRSYPLGFTCIITSISGTLSIFYISKLINKYFEKISNILSWYGKNSMYILYSHHIEWGIIQYNMINLIGNSTIKKAVLSFTKITISTIITLVGISIIKIKDSIKSKKCKEMLQCSK